MSWQLGWCTRGNKLKLLTAYRAAICVDEAASFQQCHQSDIRIDGSVVEKKKASADAIKKEKKETACFRIAKLFRSAAVPW